MVIMSAEKHEEIKRLLNQGLSLNRVVEMTHSSKTSVQKIYDELKLDYQIHSSAFNYKQERAYELSQERKHKKREAEIAEGQKQLEILFDEYKALNDEIEAAWDMYNDNQEEFLQREMKKMGDEQFRLAQEDLIEEFDQEFKGIYKPKQQRRHELVLQIQEITIKYNLDFNIHDYS